LPAYKALLLLSVLLFAGAATAGDIYKWVDEYGQTHFSDTPTGVTPEAWELPRKVNPSAGSVIANPHFNLQTIRVPFSSDGSNMIVDGRVNGVAARFIVDTGASFVVIPPSVAEKAGIKTKDAPRVTLKTVGGDISAPMVKLDSIKVGDADQSGVSAAVHQLGTSSGLGLLGMSFLDRYNMTVDRQGETLVLEKR